MAKRPRPGYVQLSKSACKAVVSFRQGIPKSQLDVANEGLCDESTVSNFELGKPITLKNAAKIAKGLGVEFKRLLALARDEVKTLDLNEDEDADWFQVTVTCRGNIRSDVTNQLEELVKLFVSTIGAKQKPRAQMLTEGSVILSLRLHSSDARRAATAFLAGKLNSMGVIALEMRYTTTSPIGRALGTKLTTAAEIARQVAVKAKLLTRTDPRVREALRSSSQHKK